MSIIGLAVHTLLLAEYAYQLSIESEEFSRPTDDPAARTQHVEAISNVLADSNKSDIIALALRSTVLADELVFALTPLECVTPYSTQKPNRGARTLWEEDRQAALQARLNEIRVSLPQSLAQFHCSRNDLTSSQDNTCNGKIDGLQRSGPASSPLRHLIDLPLNLSFSTNLYMCQAYLSLAKQYPGILSKINLAEALRFGQLAELECRDRPEDVQRRTLLDNQLAKFDRACRFSNGVICLQSETFPGRALIYYITTHVSRAEMDELESHHIPSRIDSAYDLPDFEQTPDYTKSQQAQAIDTSEGWSFDIAHLLQRENGAALSLVMQQHAESNSKSALLFNDSKSLVELLLRSGANPNQPPTSLNNPTPFEYLAIQYFKAIKDPASWAQWIDLLPTFLHHNADISVLFATSSKRPCWFTRLFQTSSVHSRIADIFSILFAHGLNPNRPHHQTSTIWTLFLENILANHIWNPHGVREYNSRTSQIHQTAEEFVRHGASLSCIVKGSQEECKVYKPAWEALWPYGYEMQMLLMEANGDEEAKPAALVMRMRGKEGGSVGGGMDASAR
ncbi:hypothetical protein EG328_008827 [Venturia inaequalis]|uniref:Ankyrin repeat protein n=1 Tax=Venturia inaequalis TaxID=5025 RepID=A0A8H3UBL9_VENIN|nr:hypothetical protein EG328_008827 [Venturia inaequalis]